MSDQFHMEEKSIGINYIFYLQTKNEVDDIFITFSEMLSKLNIALIPIIPDDLKVLDKNIKNHLIVVRNDLSSCMLFNQLRKSFIEGAMLSGRVSLYDVSSFSEIENASKYSSKESYRFLPLPANLKQLSMVVAIDFFKEKNKRLEWPGGRRAKLPSMNTEN